MRRSSRLINKPEIIVKEEPDSDEDYEERNIPTKMPRKEMSADISNFEPNPIVKKKPGRKPIPRDADHTDVPILAPDDSYDRVIDGLIKKIGKAEKHKQVGKQMKEEIPEIYDTEEILPDNMNFKTRVMAARISLTKAESEVDTVQTVVDTWMGVRSIGHPRQILDYQLRLRTRIESVQHQMNKLHKSVELNPQELDVHVQKRGFDTDVKRAEKVTLYANELLETLDAFKKKGFHEVRFTRYRKSELVKGSRETDSHSPVSPDEVVRHTAHVEEQVDVLEKQGPSNAMLKSLKSSNEENDLNPSHECDEQEEQGTYENETVRSEALQKWLQNEETRAANLKLQKNALIALLFKVDRSSVVNLTEFQSLLSEL